MIPAELLDAYLATDIDVWVPELVRIAGRDAVEVLPWASMGVITAWNPRSVPTPSDNELRNAHLADLLTNAAPTFHPAIGRGAEGWFERSFAVPDPEVDLLRDLGRRFDQHGIYVVTAEQLTVVDCDDGSTSSAPRRR